MNVSNAGFLAGAIIAVLTAAGYAGLAGLMALESACIPLPSEIILPFAGFLISTGKMNLWLVAVVGAIGCNLGSVVAYEIGRHGGRPAILRWGRYVLLSREDLDRADRFFHRFGSIAVLIARMLPVVRTFIALPAGIARMHRVRFHVYTFLGSFPWCLLLAWIGMTLGDKWGNDPRLHEAFHYFDYAIVALAALFVGHFLWTRLRPRRAGG